MNVVNASIIVEFANNDSFEGHTAGSTSSSFTDPDTGDSGIITTRSVGPAGAVLNPGGNGNPSQSRLGIDSPGNTDDADRFDTGESWTFDWNIDTEWEGIEFDGFTQSETFTVASSDFVNLTLTGPLGTGVTYDATNGVYTLEDRGNDLFDFSDLGFSSGIFVSAGTDIAITYTGSNDADIKSITFGSAVIPEASSLTVLSIFGSLTFFLWWRKRRTEAGAH